MNRKSILIVEDNIPIQNAIALILERNGYEIRVASNGEDALLFVHVCDAVLLDLILPKMDGEEFIKQIRSKGNFIPVVIMSAAFSRDEALYKLGSYGIVDFLPKPFTSRALLEQVKKALTIAEELKYVWKANDQLKGFIDRNTPPSEPGC